MAYPRYDGIIEAVHYTSGGMIAWVRVYERRGPTFSDHVLVQREELLKRLKAGKKFIVGKRREYLSSTFDVSHPLRLVKGDGQEYLAAGNEKADRDCLEGVPAL
jgi:hypothetical protein